MSDDRPKVFFTKTITPEKVVEIYQKLEKPLEGKVGIKVHSGEKGNKNFLKPEFFKPIVEHLDGTIVESNCAYPGERNTTEKHRALMDEHEWTKYFKVDILDAEEPDIKLDIPNGIAIKKNYIGKNAKNYDSILVISHFKGHQMGGYGGALKQLSIGFGSSQGKSHQHSAGVTNDQTRCWQNLCSDKLFKECMADAASSVIEFYKGNLAYINVMKNISIDCDCNGEASDPCMEDIGILASVDPVALDKACIDMVENSNDPGKKKLIERIDKLFGRHVIESAVELHLGSKEYDLVEFE